MDAEIEKVNELLDELENNANVLNDQLNDREMYGMKAFTDTAFQILHYDLDGMNAALQDDDEYNYEEARQAYKYDTDFLNRSLRYLADMFKKANNALERYL